MRRSEVISVAVLMLVPFLIFYPLFYAEYLYTDEAVQLRLYNVEEGFQMFTSQGRFITEKIFQALFQSITLVEQVTYLRLFSFFGWVLCIPIWYFVLKKVLVREGLPESFAFFTVLYLIAMPSFSIYISWASCMELFVANTAGLLSGFFLYNSLPSNRGHVHRSQMFLSLLFGLVSLFTYQTGFGCFLLPFLIHLLCRKRQTRILWMGIGCCFIIYIVYFLVFKAGVLSGIIPGNTRTGLAFDPFRKLKFFMLRPMVNAFRFTLLISENNLWGFIMYGSIAGLWFFLNLLRFRLQHLSKTIFYFLLLFFLLLAMYIPGLIVKENYASNRTMFALNLAVYLMVWETLLHFLKEKARTVLAVLSALFLLNAWYNFHMVFLRPVTDEYKKLRAFLDIHYNNGVHTIYFIRPEEDLFERMYGVNRSWDEFGVPSTFFTWVPESWTKQIIFEKTGNRALSEKITVKHWAGKEDFKQSGVAVSTGVLLMDAASIVTAGRPRVILR